MRGFTYRGIHSSVFGCYYIPNAQERGGDMPAYTVEDMDLDGADGGFYIGSAVKPRDFSLSCYVEEITAEQREGLFQWLDRKESGRLVFDHRPHVYYDVHPFKRVEIAQYEHVVGGKRVYSGTFTVSFKAYNPFGKLFRNWHNYDTAAANSIELVETGMLGASLEPQKPTPSAKEFLLYNCGFERAHTVFRLAGSAADLTIENRTTLQKCRIKELGAGDIPPGAYIEINSETGQVWLVKGEDRDLAFYYHDLGYILLAPCSPFTREITVGFKLNSKEITSPGGEFLPHMAGQYVYAADKWMKIQQVQSANKALLQTECAQFGFLGSSIVTMNEISIYGTGISLTKLEVDYTARIR